MGNDNNSKNKKLKYEWMKLDENDKKEISIFYNNYLEPSTDPKSKNKKLNIKWLLDEVFLNLSERIEKGIIPYLNSFFESKGLQRKLTTVENIVLSDILILSNIILKSSMDYEEAVYYKKNLFLILYDIINGKVGSFNTDQENLKINDIILIFNFTLLIYFNKYSHKSEKVHDKNDTQFFTEDFNNEFKEYLYQNLSPDEPKTETPKISLSSLETFIDNKLPSLDGFIKTHFIIHFYNKKNNQNYLAATQFPLFNEAPTIVPSYQFFFYCLSNADISTKKYAFKLFDCKTMGYNVGDIIYSFIGFSGKVTIMVQVYDEKQDKTIVLGMFLSGELRECYEKFCGDDYCNIFQVYPKIDFFNVTGEDKNHFVYISSKNQKYSKVKPGIGMGFRNNECRFWLDSNELFSKSFFGKYDDVYKEGTPFLENNEKLNIVNIEVYGYGNDEDLENLIKKQERDQNICNKMRKVDKSAFVNNEFNREMFFSKTFAHRNDVDERAYQENKK